MSEQFIGEIRVTSFGFPPRGWALCNGALLPINQNQALFALLGTMYGGDGRVTFALPDLRGRVPMHAIASFGYPQGAAAGEAAHTLTVSEMPGHTHPARARTPSSPAERSATPSGATWSDSGPTAYAATPTTAMSAQALSTAGGGQSHENMPPYLVLSFIIAVQGIFPSRD